MKLDKINNAFTLVELIMVMAIIAIVSVFSFWYFSDFSSKQAINEDLSNLSQAIKNLDSNVRDMKIYDYKMTLSTWSLAYITYTNYMNQDYKRLLNFDNNTFSWVIYATWILMNTWTEFSYLWYWDDKKYIDYTMDINDKYTLNLANSNKIEINSTISWSTVNDIFLNYYSQANAFTWTNSPTKLILTKINTKEDKTGNFSNTITIENINNKKFIKDQIWQIVDKEFLFFERAGKEISLEIK
jgi:prepilin-type N-terminal cleavage/methylation domain-containing protein